jgi:hypothetical protein
MFLSWRFGLTQMTIWRIEVAPFPDLLNVATPHKKAIITIPITLYMDMGMVMIGEKGVPRDGAMGGSIESTSATKPVAVADWFGLLEIGKETCSGCIQLQRLAHHAHRILIQPVQVGLLAQEPSASSR